MKSVFTALFSLFSIISIAQGPYLLDDFIWDSTNYFEAVDTLTIKDDAHIMLQDRAHEYYFEKTGDLYENKFFRQVTYINTDKGVEDNNKIYLNTTNVVDLLDYNARVLYKDKPSKELGKDALKEGTSEEGGTYKYFAIEGVEVGCMVEYYYVKKCYPTYKGTYTYLQGDYPINESRMRIASPDDLIFKAESKNGLSEMQEDSTYAYGNLLALTTFGVSKLPEEGFSNVSRNRYQVLYKLTENKANNSRNLFQFGEISQGYFEGLLPSDPKKDKKTIDKFLKGADLAFAADERDKILRIENHIKKRIGIVNSSDTRLNDINFMIENSATTEFGMIKLMFQALYLNDINFEVVLTCNRYSTLFHEDIESYTFLDETLFYFPGIDDYMAPSAVLYRTGIIPYGYIGNNGLFIRSVSVGDFVTGAGSIKKIGVYPKDHSVSDMFMTVTFDETFEHTTVDLKQTFTGFNALNLQPMYDYIPADKMNEFKESIVKGLGENIEVVSVELEAQGADNFMKIPFAANSTYKSEEFIELAGNKILFKVGELIGPQAEMYEEEERLTDVVNTYNHGYTREITFNIPEGYKCSNLDDLKLDFDPFKDDGSHTLFKSDYTLEGNTVKVYISEYYDELILEKSEFEDFRSVINAAADFNKITLVFEEA